MARIFFRRTSPEFRSVRGQAIARIQQVLDGDGLLEKGVDGRFGADTEQALRRFQEANRLPQSGAIDLDTWRLALYEEAPALFDRCLQLTADFEGHGFGLAQGNFDGAGLTWGVIGFTLAHGEIGGIVDDADAIDRALVDDAFGALAPELRRKLSLPRTERVAWGDSISLGPRKTGVAPPWSAAFRSFGEKAPVQRLQTDRARRYWRDALRIVDAYEIPGELGHALAFDIAVQNGGIDAAEAEEIGRRLAGAGAAGQRQTREVIANVVAENSAARWVEDVRRRKLAIAQGEGVVHEAKYRLRDWGLEEAEVA